MERGRFNKFIEELTAIICQKKSSGFLFIVFFFLQSCVQKWWRKVKGQIMSFTFPVVFVSLENSSKRFFILHQWRIITTANDSHAAHIYFVKRLWHLSSVSRGFASTAAFLFWPLASCACQSGVAEHTSEQSLSRAWAEATVHTITDSSGKSEAETLLLDSLKAMEPFLCLCFKAPDLSFWPLVSQLELWRGSQGLSKKNTSFAVNWA